MPLGPNEQILRDLADYFNANLERVLADEEVPIDRYMSEDVELINFEPSPFPGTYRGHEGFVRWTQDLFGDFTEGRVELLEMREEGDLVAVKLRMSGRGRGSGAAGALEWGSLFTMRDRVCIRAASDPSYEMTLERLEAERRSS